MKKEAFQCCEMSIPWAPHLQFEDILESIRRYVFDEITIDGEPREVEVVIDQLLHFVLAFGDFVWPVTSDVIHIEMTDDDETRDVIEVQRARNEMCGLRGRDAKFAEFRTSGTQS
jgi:hypothetical protein